MPPRDSASAGLVHNRPSSIASFSPENSYKVANRAFNAVLILFPAKKALWRGRGNININAAPALNPTELHTSNCGIGAALAMALYAMLVVRATAAQHGK